MPFPTNVQQTILPVTEGELLDAPSIVLSTASWEEGLIIGRFAQIKAGVLSNMDGTATPVVAGVVLRELNSLIELPGEAGAAVTNLLISETVQDYVRQGLVTVKLAAGAATPTMFAPVYAVNEAANAENGNVTPTSAGTTVETNGEFIEQIQAGIWSVRLK